MKWCILISTLTILTGSLTHPNWFRFQFWNQSGLVRVHETHTMTAACGTCTTAVLCTSSWKQEKNIWSSWSTAQGSQTGLKSSVVCTLLSPNLACHLNNHKTTATTCLRLVCSLWHSCVLTVKVEIISA